MFGTNPLRAGSNYWDYLVPVSGKLTSVHQLLPNLCDSTLFSPKNEESPVVAENVSLFCLLQL